MARAQPLIAVRDVDASARWYAELLGLEGNGETHGGLYERLMRGDQLVLQLHAWDRTTGERRQITDEPVGLIAGELTPDGEWVAFR